MAATLRANYHTLGIRPTTARTEPITRIERLAQLFTIHEDGCWKWNKANNDNGYGQYRDSPAHRFMWELINGPIPPKLVIDHICRVRSCINPKHLRPATLSENSLNRPFPKREPIEYGVLRIRKDDLEKLRHLADSDYRTMSSQIGILIVQAYHKAEKPEPKEKQ